MKNTKLTTLFLSLLTLTSTLTFGQAVVTEEALASEEMQAVDQTPVATDAGKPILVLPGLYKFYTDKELIGRLSDLKAQLQKPLTPEQKARFERVLILTDIIKDRKALTPEQRKARRANLKSELLAERKKALFNLTTAKATPFGPDRDKQVTKFQRKLDVIDALLER